MAGVFDAFEYDAPSYPGSGGLLSLIREQAAYKDPVNSASAPIDTAPDAGQMRRAQIGSGPNADMTPQSGNPPSHDPGDAQRNVRPDVQLPQQTRQLFPPTPQDFAQRFIAGLSGVSSGVRSGGMLSGIPGGINGLSIGILPDSRPANGLAERVISPGPTQTIARDPEFMRAVLPRILGLANKTGGAGKSGVKLGVSGDTRFIGSPVLSGKARRGVS